jgi:membrane protein DedA with SNARE-associated domain
VLRLLCRISLSPDSCVNQTEDRFRRYGPKSLLVSKFIPGFNTIAAPMSGALGTGTRAFLGFPRAAALLWGGTGIALGACLPRQRRPRAGGAETMGSAALMVLGGLLALFVAL